MLSRRESTPRSSRAASMSQVTSMETYSKVLLSSAEKEKYVAQRQENGRLTDQRLLASIIASNPKRLRLFWNAYPAIFAEELSTM